MAKQRTTFDTLPEYVEPMNADDGGSLCFTFVLETSTKTQTERKRVELQAVLTTSHAPESKSDAIAIARMYAAIKAYRTQWESDYFADYRQDLKNWRERMEAIADGDSGLEAYPKPDKPEVADDVAAQWNRLDNFLSDMRKTYGKYGKHTFKVGDWQGTLSAVLNHRPSMVKIAAG